MEKETMKKPDVLLWFITRYLLIIIPMCCTLIAFAKLLGLPDSTWNWFFAGFICDRILSWYETLDFEVTNFLIDKIENDV
jgi:hypothetical protein